MIQLRPYQIQAIDAIKAAYRRGIQRQMLVLATGLGKTLVFSHLISECLNARILVLVHRDELARQTRDKICMVNPDLADMIGVVKARENDADKPIVIASIPTVCRDQRLAPILPRDMVIIDEAHHVEPPSKKRPDGNEWYRVMMKLQSCANLTLGCTATPYRPNNSPLIGDGLPFEEAPYTMGIAEGIYQGYLCGIQSKHITIEELNLDGLKRVAGDWTDGALDRALLSVDAPTHLLEAWTQHGKGRKTLIFTPGVDMAEATATTFNEAGFRSAAVLGKTPVDERQAIFKLWRGGELDVVVNCAVLTEGFDEPSVDCLMIARPTTSRVLYQQIVGRGLRTFPGKENCLILDLAGATQRHQLMSVAHITGLAQVVEEEDCPDCQPNNPCRLHQSREGRSDGDDDRVSGKTNGKPSGRVAINSQEINLYRKSPMRWFQTRDGRHALELKDAFLELVPCDRGGELWEARYRERKSVKALVRHVPLEMAQGVAEDTARDMGNEKLLQRTSAWLDQPPTAAQLKYAGNLGIANAEIIPTRGAISLAIGEAKLRQWDMEEVVVEALNDLYGAVRSGTWDYRFIRDHLARADSEKGYWCSKKERRILARMIRERLHDDDLAKQVEG